MDKDKKTKQEISEFEKHHLEENGLMGAKRDWRLFKETSNDNELVEFNNVELTHIKKQQFQKNNKTGKFENYYGRSVDTFEESIKENSNIRNKARKILKDENKVNQFLYYKVDKIDKEEAWVSMLNRLQTRKSEPKQSKPPEHREAEFVVPYSQPLMTSEERRSLEREIEEIKFKELTKPNLDPDLAKGLGALTHHIPKKFI